MESLQLQLNIDDLSDSELKLQNMQRQIDAACSSMDKVRRKLFAEQGEWKKLVLAMQVENLELKQKLKEISGEKIEWTYQKEGCLFDVQDPLQAFC